MINFDEISKEVEIEDDFDWGKWLYSKLFEHYHLGQEELPFLRQFLKGDQKDACENLASKLREKRPKNDPELTRLKLQKTCISLAKKPENKMIHLRDIQNILQYVTEPKTEFADSEFAKDVSGIIQELHEKGRPPIDTSKLSVVITDDPIDLLLCGTDVGGSCQRVDGKPELNKGLLGYLMDGKNKLLAIKDQKGRVLARCILRLMWDGEKPVIFREFFYPDMTRPFYKAVLNNLAKMFAKELKLTLTSRDKGTSYGKPLQALGGNAPFEYCDASRGLQKEGKYTINNANVIPYE